MDEYDVVVVGGGIAGSVAAKKTAEQGLNTLLIEKCKTPRNKPCSGIQFTYFEKLLGERIPREKLCVNELNRVEIITPSGMVLGGRMNMLNFWRQTLDSWLNERAIKAGAEFRDEALLEDFNREGDWMKVKLAARGAQWELRTHYLVGADGMFSRTRMKLRPRVFARKRLGAAINYYFTGKANLNPNTLYMFFMREYAPLMFAWVYMKDDNWVIGTGSENDPLGYSERFLNYVKTKYCLHGELVRREGFASLPMDIYLGEGNVLVIGDAAGLIDLHRGLGMDNAALSGRLATKAIVASQETGLPAIKTYTRLMERSVKRLESNSEKQHKIYSSDEMLERSLSPFNMLIGGLRLIISEKINKILPAERMIFLPT